MSFRIYRDLEPGEQIVVGVDTSMGLNDYCVGIFLSKDKMDIPIIYQEKVVANEMTPKIFNALEKIYSKTNVPPIVAYERNNGGVFEMERLSAMNQLNRFRVFEMPSQSGTPKLGWDTTSATRPKMLAELKEAIDKQLIVINDKAMIEEMFSFVLIQTSTAWKAQAERGAHDDLIMATAIAWQLQQTAQFAVLDDLPDQDLFNDDGFY